MTLDENDKLGSGQEMDEFMDDLSSGYREEEQEEEPPERAEEVSYERGEVRGEAVEAPCRSATPATGPERTQTGHPGQDGPKSAREEEACREKEGDKSQEARLKKKEGEAQEGKKGQKDQED